MYQAQFESTSRFVVIRGLNYHLREWVTGDRERALASPERTLILVHGWMDVSASFQFMVDCLEGDWRVIALDWRGFGLTSTPAYDNYWFPDYLADLDMVLDALQLDRVNLVGHSMGGNISMLYAGVRPERIARLVNLEGTGMPATHPKQAAGRYRNFMDEIKRGARLKSYDRIDEVAARLMKNNARLDPDRARYLAEHWSRQNAEGRWELQADPAHKLASPVLYHVEEVIGIWRRITAPVLMLLAGERDQWHQFINTPEYRRRLLAIPDLRLEEVEGVGHMMHHDKPKVIASMVEGFLRS